MLRLSGTCVLSLACGSIAFCQVAATPATWIGTWSLSVPESDASNGEFLEITSTSGHLKITSYTVPSQREPSREEFNLSLDGKETVFPEGPRLSFKRIDDLTFDVTVRVNNQRFGNHTEEIHFVVSPDGNTLTETKTHTERAVVPDGIDQLNGAVIKTSKSVLVFEKLLFIPPAGPVFLRYVGVEP
jgi:hypothetical protein